MPTVDLNSEEIAMRRSVRLRHFAFAAGDSDWQLFLVSISGRTFGPDLDMDFFD